jgi:hypothetical protein
VIEAGKKPVFAIFVEENVKSKKRYCSKRSCWLGLESKQTNHGDLHKQNCYEYVVVNIRPVLAARVITYLIHILHLQIILINF